MSHSHTGRAGAVPYCRFPLTSEQLEDRVVPALTFRFDYSFDSAGLFNNPAARAALEQAGADLSARITSTPGAIVPGGNNTWQATFFNPTTGAQVSVPNLTVPDGVMIVYAGGAGLGGSQVGEGGPGGWSAAGTRAFQQQVSTRGQSGFAAWGGSVSFKTNENWYFGSDAAGLPANTPDFYSVATHELGHLLGIGASTQWDNLVSNGVFTGGTAIAVHGSAPAVSPDASHWAQGTTSPLQNTVSMQPVLTLNQRVAFSELDYAALADLGWQVTGLSVGTASQGGGSSPVVAAPTTPGVADGRLIAATGPTNGSVLQYVVGADGSLTPSGPVFQPFGDFRGAVRAVTADFNGDGIADLAVGTGPYGGSFIRVFDGKTGADLVPQFSAYESSFTGGVFLAAGDFDGDGRAELVTSPDQGGGARIRVFSFGSGTSTVRNDFFGINDTTFFGGARVAVGDVNGDGRPDLVVSAGFGGGPRVSVYDGAVIAAGGKSNITGDFFAFEPGLRNGVYVSVSDVDGDGCGDLILGAGPGGGPRVLVVSGRMLTQAGGAAAVAAPVLDFFAGSVSDRGGVRVLGRDINGDGRAEVFTGSGLGNQLSEYSGTSLITTVSPFAGVASDGVYVG